MQDQAYIGRGPILDKHQTIVGYELLFRHTGVPAADGSDALQADAQALVDALRSGSTDWALENKLALLRVPTSLLMGDFSEQLPADRVILEIADATPPTPELLARCRKLRADGVRLALNNFELTAETAPLLEIAHFVKVDPQQTGPDKIEALDRALEGHSGKLLATGVDTRAAYEQAKKLGFAYFQGFYFLHPETLSAKTINPAYANVLDVLKKVRDNAEVKDIELSFKRDVALSFKLLRYINSVGFGLSCEIQSIRHALAILGYQQLYRWATLLLVSAEKEASSPALLKTAVTRGRLTELFGQELLEPKDRDNLFVVGVFSLLDAMMEMPMEKVLDKLFLPDTVTDALLHHQGIYGPFLALAEACEQGEPDRIDKLASALQLGPGKINRAHIEALAWVEKLGL